MEIKFLIPAEAEMWNYKKRRLHAEHDECYSRLFSVLIP